MPDQTYRAGLKAIEPGEHGKMNADEDFRPNKTWRKGERKDRCGGECGWLAEVVVVKASAAGETGGTDKAGNSTGSRSGVKT
jgi:hypothetical protein